MTSTLHAHFDGRVIIPDEPVDLPVGQSLTLQISTARNPGPEVSDEIRQEALRQFLSGPIEGASISAESLRRETLYEDED